MDKVKFILTFLTASGIIMGGYFFANNVPGIKNAIEEQGSGNKLGLDNPLLTGEDDESGLFTEGAAAYAPTNAQGNITRLIAQSMFFKMKQLDQDGTNPFEALDSDTTREMIDGTVRNVPESIFRVSLDNSELKITQDNSRAAKMRYIEGIDRITRKYFSGSGVDRFKIASAKELTDNIEKDCFGDGSSAKNAEISKAYKEVFDEYKALTTPSTWLALHKLILMHFKELSDIYGSFGQCKEDPIRAYVGIDKLPEVYARTADIQKMINQKAIELGLQ